MCFLQKRTPMLFAVPVAGTAATGRRNHGRGRRRRRRPRRGAAPRRRRGAARRAPPGTHRGGSARGRGQRPRRRGPEPDERGDGSTRDRSPAAGEFLCLVLLGAPPAASSPTKREGPLRATASAAPALTARTTPPGRPRPRSARGSCWPSRFRRSTRAARARRARPAAVGLAAVGSATAPRCTASSPGSRSTASCSSGRSTSARSRSFRSSRRWPRTGPAPARDRARSVARGVARRGSPRRRGSRSKRSAAAGPSVASRGVRWESRCTTSRSPGRSRASVASCSSPSSSSWSTGCCSTCSSAGSNEGRTSDLSSSPRRSLAGVILVVAVAGFRASNRHPPARSIRAAPGQRQEPPSHPGRDRCRLPDPEPPRARPAAAG